MIDYEGIVKNLQPNKIIELMTSLGAEDYKETEGYIIFPTICHNEDADNASKKLYYYKDSHVFYCYTECGSQNIFKFLKNYYETRGIAYDWYRDIYQVVKECSSYTQSNFKKPTYTSLKEKYGKNDKTIELPQYDENVLGVFVKHYPPEWLDDGITKEAMDKYNILYSISQNKIVIPHYDTGGRLVGIRGRALNAYEVETFGKYMPMQIEGKWYTHPLSMNLYGLNKSIETIRKTGICFLVESEKACLQVENFSIPNATAAVCGSNFNKFALNILMKEASPKEIVICFDKEEKQGSDEYFNKLYSLGKKYSNYCNFSFIYDRQNLLNLKESPTDRGEETFLKLLERRVKIK